MMGPQRALHPFKKWTLTPEAQARSLQAIRRVPPSDCAERPDPEVSCGALGGSRRLARTRGTCPGPARGPR